MFRILKVVLLGWLGKKLFDYAQTDEEPAKQVGNRPKSRGSKSRARHA